MSTHFVFVKWRTFLTSVQAENVDEVVLYTDLSLHLLCIQK